MKNILFILLGAALILAAIFVFLPEVAIGILQSIIGPMM